MLQNVVISTLTSSVMGLWSSVSAEWRISSPLRSLTARRFLRKCRPPHPSASRRPSHPPPPRRFSSFVFSPSVFPSSQLGLKPAEFKGGNGGRRRNWRNRNEEEEDVGGGWLVSVNILEAASTYFFKMHSTTSAAEFSWYESAGLPWHIFLSVCLTMWHTLKCLTFYFNLLSLFSKRRYIFIIRVFTKAISPRTRYCQSKSRYSIHFLHINFTLCIHWTLNIAC